MATRVLTDTATISWDEATLNQVKGNIVADSVTNALLANMVQATIKGRATGAGTGDPTDLTPAQVRAILGLATTDSPAFAGLALPAGGAISWNSGAAAITELGGILSVNGTPFSANIQATGLNGIEDDQLFIYRTYTAEPTTDIALLRVQRQDTFTGGTGGQGGTVNMGIWALHTVGANVTNNQWTILAQLNNDAAATGENVAIYAQGNKRSTGSTWAGVMQAIDTTGTANPANALVGCEVDVEANGTDNAFHRIGIELALFKHGVGTAVDVGHGIRLGPSNADPSHGRFVNGISLTFNFGTGINLSAADCTVADIVTKGAVGFGTSTPDRRLHSEVGDAVTAATTYAARLTHTTSGTAAIAFGVGLEAELENASGTNKVAAALDWIWTDATNGSEDADLLIKLMTAGAAAATVARFSSTGFLGLGANVTPAVALDIAGTGDTQIRAKDGGTVDMRMLASSSSGVGFVGTFSNHSVIHYVNAAEVFRTEVAGPNLASGKVLKVNSTQVVTSRQTGWTAATNTKTRTTFDTTTVTLPILAAHVGALIDDLITHGLIGT